MSLPRDVQAELVHALPGLEDAVMLRPGYAVEYDFIQPTELTRRLETKRVGGPVSRRPDQRHVRLRGGGGAGSRRRHQRRAASRVGGAGFELRRDEAYIGILVDDLITKGCLEPYRMFTSRAEHRLLLRIDNADLRLTPRRPRGGTGGRRAVGAVRRAAGALRSESADARRDAGSDAGRAIACPASQLLRQPEIRLSDLRRRPAASRSRSDPAAAPSISRALETTVKYAGYLRRQESEIERARRTNGDGFRPSFPFDRVPGLSREVVQRLTQVRPDTLGHALRIPGVTPAAVAVLGTYVGAPDSSMTGRRISPQAAERRARRRWPDTFRPAIAGSSSKRISSCSRTGTARSTSRRCRSSPLTDDADRSAVRRAACRSVDAVPTDVAERMVRSGVWRRLTCYSAEADAATAPLDDDRVEGAKGRFPSRGGAQAGSDRCSMS